MEQNPAPITTIREPELCGGLLDHFETLSPPPVRLEEAWRRFENEAVHGVCVTDRYRCPYFIWGTGPPLVFIHGLGDVAHSYVPVISALSSDFTCIAYEQPGGRRD